jgi:hypothetical protein
MGSLRNSKPRRRRCTHPPRAPSLPDRHAPTDLPALAVGVNRSRREETACAAQARIRTVMGTRFVAHRCTRGSRCRAHRARAAASIRSSKRAGVCVAVPRTARGDRRSSHQCARNARCGASSPFRPLKRRAWCCRPSGSVRRRPRCAPTTVRVGVHGRAGACTTIRRYWAQVFMARRSVLALFRPNPNSKSDFSPCAANAAACCDFEFGGFGGMPISGVVCYMLHVMCCSNIVRCVLA